MAARPIWRLSPGWLKLALAVVGVAVGLRRRNWRRWTLFLLLTAVLAFALSLGPNLTLGSERSGVWQPWWTLTHFCPGVAQVRNVFRFAFFVQMAVVLLAAQGVAGLLFWNRVWLRRWLPRSLTTLVIGAVGLAAVLEVRPLPTKFVDLPDATANARWIEFIRRETSSGKSIACFPFATGDRIEELEISTRWMYYQTFHGVPMVNGYSGFFPARYFEVRNYVRHSFLTEPLLHILWTASVEFLVIDRKVYLGIDLNHSEIGPYRFECVHRDDTGIDIYRLRRIDPAVMSE